MNTSDFIFNGIMILCSKYAPPVGNENEIKICRNICSFSRKWDKNIYASLLARGNIISIVHQYRSNGKNISSRWE